MKLDLKYGLRQGDYVLKYGHALKKLIDFYLSKEYSYIEVLPMDAGKCNGCTHVLILDESLHYIKWNEDSEHILKHKIKEVVGWK